MDHAVHQIDTLRWLLQTEPIKLSAQIKNIFHENTLNINDYGIATIEFADKSLATIESSWIVSPFSKYIDKIYIETPVLSLIRERGLVKVNAFFTDQQKQTIHEFPQGPTVEVSSGHKIHIQEFERIIEHFIDVINNKSAPIANCFDGVMATKICDLCYKSSNMNKIIHIK